MLMRHGLVQLTLLAIGMQVLQSNAEPHHSAAVQADSPADMAQCLLVLEGSNTTSLVRAVMLCTGSITAAANSVLGPHMPQFSGVTWSNASREEASTCLITICAGSRVNFTAATITGVGPTGVDSILCITEDSDVRFHRAKLLDNAGDEAASNADATKGSIVRVNGTARLTLDSSQAQGNRWLSVIEADGDSSVTISNSRFEDNCGRVNGPVLRTQGAANIGISNSSFIENQVVAHHAGAGAIWAAGTGSIAIVNSTFISNLVAGFEARGGAFVIEGNRTQPVVIQDSWFDSNRVRGDGISGGALYLRGTATAASISNIAVNMTNVTLTANIASGPHARGAAIMAYGVSGLTLQHCILRNNTSFGQLSEGAALGIGGMSVFRTPEPIIHMYNTSVVDNTAELGAGISITGGLVTVKAVNSVLSGNNAAMYGGLYSAVADSQGHIKLDLHNCTVNNNQAAVDGGALFVRQSSTKAGRRLFINLLDGTSFENNTAGSGSGGAMCLWGGVLYIGDGVSMLNNSAGGQNGGAFAIYTRWPGAGDIPPPKLHIPSGMKRDEAASVAKTIQEIGGYNTTVAALVLAKEGIQHVRISHNLACKMGGGLFVEDGVGGNWRAAEDALAQVVTDNDAVTCYDMSLPNRCSQTQCTMGCCHYNGRLDEVLGMCVSCPSGTHKFSPNASETCALCPTPGGVCPGGSNVFAEPGFWTSYTPGSTKPPSILKCPNPLACTNALKYSRGSHDNLAHLCHNNQMMTVTNHVQCDNGYHGVLCGQCKKTFNQRVPFVCTPCAPHALAVLRLVMVGIVVVALVYVQWSVAWSGNCRAASSRSFEASDCVKVIIWFCQGLVIISEFGLEIWLQQYQQLLSLLATMFTPGGVGSFASLFCALGPDVAHGGTVPWAFERAVATLLMPLMLVVGTALFHIVVRLGAAPIVGWVANWQLGTIRHRRIPFCSVGACCRGCKAAAAGVSRSLGLNRPLWPGGFVAGKGYDSGGFFADMLQRLPLLCVVVLQWCYPSLLRVAWSFLACVNVDGLLLWLNDLDVKCWEGQHLAWASSLGVIMIVLFCVLVPVSVVVAPKWLCRNVPKKSESGHPTEAALSFSGYKLPSGAVTPTGLQIACPAQANGFAGPSITSQAAQPPSDQGSPNESAAPGLQPPLAPCMASLANFLYKSYRENQGHWEVVTQLRLVMLVLIAVFAPIIGNFYSQIAIGVVLTLCMLLQMVVKPVKDLAFNHLQLVCYVCLLMNVVGGVLLHVDARNLWHNPRTQPAVSLVVLLFNIAFFVWALLLILVTTLAGHGCRGATAPGQVLCSRVDGWWVLRVKFFKSRPGDGLAVPITHTGAWHQPV